MSKRFGLIWAAVVATTILLALLLARLAGTNSHAIWLLSLVWLAATAAVLIPAFLLLRQSLRSIDEITEGCRRVTDGAYGHKTYSTAGHFSQLALAFNAMSERLAEQFTQVEADRQQLRAILGGMIEGVVAIDATQRLLFANEKASQILEFHAKMAIGHKLWEIVRHRAILSLVDRALESMQPQREELDWKGAANRSLAVYVAPLPAALDQGAILVLHDLSELRRLERLRHEFVANVSHELKTPLAVIKACVETLQDGAIDDPANRNSFLDQVNENADRLHNLILDLLNLARIESGSQSLEIQTVVISDLVRDCIEHLRPRAEAKRQTIEILAPPEPSAAEIRTDEEALRQMLENLVDNAIKYTPDEGRIRIRWYGRGDQICFEVEDNGIGIPEVDLPRIFERFYRVDKARSREMGGTGLGLAIVKNLAQILRGSVKAASELGKGSVFTLSLPRSAA